jgi:hypothetical protein
MLKHYFLLLFSSLLLCLFSCSSIDSVIESNGIGQDPLIKMQRLESLVDQLSNELKSIKENVERLPKPYPIGMVTIIASNVIDDWFTINGAGFGEYTGWFICDGRNRTPNMTGRFIVGRDVFNRPSDYAEVGVTGGLAKVQLTEEEMPNHSTVSSFDLLYNYFNFFLSIFY